MRTLICLSLLCVAGASLAQVPARSAQDDMPVEAYLTLLGQLAPPARQGAEAYMAAFLTRCGRPLRTIELRRAFSDGSGDPVLMRMIRASHERDTASLQRLSSSVVCNTK